MIVRCDVILVSCAPPSHILVSSHTQTTPFALHPNSTFLSFPWLFSLWPFSLAFFPLADTFTLCSFHRCCVFYSSDTLLEKGTCPVLPHLLVLDNLEALLACLLAAIIREGLRCLQTTAKNQGNWFGRYRSMHQNRQTAKNRINELTYSQSGELSFTSRWEAL